MDFDLAERERFYRDRVREFIETRIRPRNADDKSQLAWPRGDCGFAVTVSLSIASVDNLPVTSRADAGMAAPAPIPGEKEEE